MNITVNDRPMEFAAGTTVGQIMQSLGLQPKGIAVAIDGKLVKADAWSATVPADGASLTIIRAFYGG